MYIRNIVVSILKLWILKITWHCRYERYYIKLWRDNRILDSLANTVTRLNRTTRLLFQAGKDSECYFCHYFRSNSRIRLGLFTKVRTTIALWINGRSVELDQEYASVRIWWRHVSLLVSVKAYFVIEVWNIKLLLLRWFWYLLLTPCPQNVEISSISAS